MRRLIALLSFTMCSLASAQYAWPVSVVSIEEMKMLSPFTISVPRSRPKGEVMGPSVVRAHIDIEGRVRHVALLESCGSPAHDEAAMLAIRNVTFRPKQIGGVPAEVSLVVPLHLPISKHRPLP